MATAQRTPFGEKLAELRARRGMTLAQLAARLSVSPAYLSALETGRRGVANRRLLHQICQIFAIIWDEADALSDVAKRSDPRPSLDVRGKSANRVRLANILSDKIPSLSEAEVAQWLTYLAKERARRKMDQETAD